MLDFISAAFFGSAVDFSAAVNFKHAVFSGGTIDLRDPTAWFLPPLFDSSTPPYEVKLPSP